MHSTIIAMSDGMQAGLLQVATHAACSFGAAFGLLLVVFLVTHGVVSGSLRLAVLEMLLRQREMGLQIGQWLSAADLHPLIGALLVGVAGIAVGTVGWIVMSAVFMPSLHTVLHTLGVMLGAFLASGAWAVFGMKIGNDEASMGTLIARTHAALDSRKSEMRDALRSFGEASRHALTLPSVWVASAIACGALGAVSPDETTRFISWAILAIDACLVLRGLYLMCPACHTFYGMFHSDSSRTSLGQQWETVHRMNPVFGTDFGVAGWVRTSEQQLRERFLYTDDWTCSWCGHETSKSHQ